MSGRPKRGPGRPRLVDTGMSPTRCIPPASPLTPDSEEGFIVNEHKSSRARGRPKGPIKKTRVNAQSKLKSPIRAAHSGSSTERIDDELDFKKEAAYANAVDAMGQPLVKDPNLPTSDEFVPSDKVCAFCCCGPERRMYQGKLHLCAPTPGFNPFKKAGQIRRQNSTPEPLFAEPADNGKEAIDDVPQPQPMVHRRGPGRPPGRGRKKGAVVIGLPFRNNGQSLSPDKCMFGSVREKDVSELFESDGSVYAHHCCASWSEGVCQTDSYDLVNVDKAVFSAMNERCTHCNRYGASVVCQVPRCEKTYHYPCAASAGAFQEIQSMTMLCPDHLEDAGRLGGIEAQCYLCGEAKDFSEMLFCTSCGRHYHGRCLDPAVDITSLVRMSWQCPDCKVCQGCRQPGDDTKMLVCDLCDKGFHTYCLDPPMTTIPKTGWKCVGCRRCEDCGSNTPGGGPTSRWHRHYTVCDSCYQQRNKGLFCQICGRAYRQLSDVAMVQCDACEKWLHAECDNVSEEVYNKINSKKMSYYCPQCKGNGVNHVQMNHKDSLSFEDNSMNDDPVMSTSGEEDKRTLTSAAIGRITPSPMDEDLNLIGLESNLDELSSLRPFGDSLMDPESLPLGTDSKLPLDEEMESVMKPDLDMFESSSGLPDSPPPSDHANEAKAVPSQSFRSFAITPPKTGGKRKLGPKLKAKTNSTPAKKKAKHGKPGRPPTKLKKQASVQSSPGKENVSGAANAAENTAKEEETEGLHTTLVLFSADDKFTTEQDMCLCCGSFGKGREGQMIACSQCGQSYHPYCVGVKVNKIILNNGWRCLDCTLCEGCGKGSDEARLLLCDSCDISYHTYCLDPPLEKVPQGGWKCKWCVTCYDCGTLSPGKECEWQSNYTQCGPCASKITCPVCSIKYNENDLMIQCLNCDRWLHGSCDKLLTEDEVDKAAEYGYHCLFCRPKTKRALVCLSGPPSPRATALHHYRPQFSLENHPPQPQAKPIHPCQRLTNNGIVEMKLSNHFGRASLAMGNQSIAENENFLLTDSGLKQMNRLKISAYGRRKVKSKAKVKAKKPGMKNASDVINKMEVMSPEHDSEASKSSDFDENAMDNKGDVDYKPYRTKTTGRVGAGGFLVRGRGAGARKFAGRGSKLAGRRKDRQLMGMPRGHPGRQQSSFGGSTSANMNLPNFFAQQQSSLEAIMDSSSNEAWPEDSDRLPLQEAYPDWMQEAFFGKSLLNPSSRKKKPKQEPATPTALSEEGLSNTLNKQQDHSKTPGNIQRAGYGYPFSGDNHLHSQGAPHQNQQEVFNRSGQPSTSHSVIGLEGGENWQGSNVEGLPADPLSLSEEFPNPDVLYRSLDMLSEDMPSSDGQTVSRAMEQEQSHLPDGSSQPNPDSNTSSVPSSQLQPPARGQQGELDLLSAAIDILPHVDGQEVEDIFADIEMEMKSRDAVVYSGIGGATQTSITPQVSRPTTEPRVPPPAYQAGHQDIQSFQQGQHPQPMEPGLTHFPHFGQNRENFQGRPDIRNQHALPGQYGYEGDHDFPKRNDIDLASDLPRDRRPPSPRTDPMKQQQKWQEDEKLGATATISPVLYANLEHANLQKEYPDWPNRYRAIARLWRKLTVEQRDPYRLKARDNRVKLKDQGKRAMLEQSKEKRGKSTPTHATQSPAKTDLEMSQSTLCNPSQPQIPESPQVDMEHQGMSSLNQDNDVTAQIQQSMPSQSNPPPYLSPAVTPIGPSQQPYQEMMASTQQSCVTPTPPLTMSDSRSPVTPTSFTPTSSMNMFAQPNVDALTGGKGSRNGKGKKTKEDKEKEKERRKQKLLIQQQQERQWKMLQQRRQLEQQRQQQQQQQETNQMRQEVKRTQQAKGLRALEDKKKKTPPKPLRKQSFSDTLSNVSSVSSENQEHGSNCDTPSQHSPAVSIHSDDSHSLTSAHPRDTSLIDSQMPDGIRERRGSLPNLALSSHGLENMRPLSPLGNSSDTAIRRSRSSSQQLPQGPWDEWHNEVPQQQDQSNPMWCDSTINTLTQSQPNNEPKPPSYSSPMAAMQNSRPQSSDNNYMPTQPGPEQHPQEGSRHEGLNFYVPQDQQRPQLTPGLPQASSEGLSMPSRDPSQGDTGEMQYHPQGMMNDQQVRNMDSQQSLTHKQHDVPQWHPEMLQNHPQAGAQEQIVMAQGVPNQPNMMPQNQAQPKLQHPDLSRPHPYDFQQNWQHSSSGPNSMVLQQPPQVQQASIQQQVPVQQMPIQPMTSMPNSSQNLPLPHPPLHHQSGMTQVPIQPAPPPPPPPPPLPQPQHSNLPMSRQPPTDEQQQQQQLEMLQKQQREQLMRAQQQQYLQMQMQQQQHLMQQQQQPVAMQPPFARPRMNPVVNTKDLPEIDSEEEHQERLRFLYRQRQLQKQQQMQLQAQQSFLQQPWQGPGLIPGLMPSDPSNPQMAQIRPQPSDMMQQQLVLEYQRRMQQRQDLGQQSIQFDKVLQDLHQQQGTQPGHQPPPFLEVSHQRLAMRHPTPGVQPGMGPMVPGQVPGQLPMMGMDGQHLYRMQLQQQQILMQQQHQQSPRMIAQKQTPQIASAVSKENVPDKEDKTVAPNQDSAPTESTSTQPGSVVSKDTSQNCDKGEEKESEQSEKSEENQPVQPDQTAPEKQEETAATCGNSANVTGEGIQIPDSGKSTEGETLAESGEDSNKQQKPEAEQSIENGSANTSNESATNKDTNSSTEEIASEEKAEKQGDGKDERKNEEASKIEEEQQQSIPEGENATNSSGPPDEKNSTAERVPSQDQRQLTEAKENQNKLEAEVVGATTGPEKQSTTIQQSFPIQPRVQDVTVPQQMQPLSVSQAQVPNQQQALHQQLMALQQRFFQMQQQRQMMMQQYQQLQQQLQQNQDPMVGGQLMTLQQQGQFLQQNLLQVWQQIQMLQQQIQNSSNLQQPQQLLPQPSLQGPPSGQGQQWNQGPMQEQQNMPPLGMMSPHPGMMNNPGVMQPPLPGQVPSTPSPKPDKPARKPRRSRAKSKDTLAPQQPSLSDWMNPQPMPAKPVKTKGKKGKKQQEAQDPEIQLQQQRLRQQILHQMEQRHRLIQQHQGSASGGALAHPDISGSPRESGPPTPQSADGAPGHPVGPTQHPFGPASSQSNVPPPNDSISFSGSPSMGIMTPEQINYSTSQLMNNPLAFPMNQPQPNQQPINPAAQKPELRPAAPVPCSPKPQPMPHTPGPPSEPSSPFLGGRRPDEPTNPHSVPPDESFTQRFPTPERFLQFTQQQVRHKQPVVEYVADANNPFSDDFQIQKNLKAEKPQPKKGGPKKKVIKEEPQASAVSEVRTTDGPTPDKIRELDDSTVSDVQKAPSSFEDAIPSEIEKGPIGVAASMESSKAAVTTNSGSKPDRNEHNDDMSKHEVISGNSNEVLLEDVTDGKKGVSSQALQRLESMVADMASEDVCDEQVKSINTSDLTYDLFNENADEEVANLCSVASMESSMGDKDHQTLSLCKSSSQANSVASLECHEEVPSFISPTQDGEKPDERDRSQESSPIPQSLDTDPKVLCTPDIPGKSSGTSEKKEGSDESQDVIHDGNVSNQEPGTLGSEAVPKSVEATVLTETVSSTTANQTLASSQDIEQQPLTSLSGAAEPCTVSSSITPVSDVPSSSVASGVLGGHLALPMESQPTEGDMAIFRQYNPSTADVSFSMNQASQVMTTTQSTDHGAMLLSGRDPMLGGASPMLSSSSSSLNPVSVSKGTGKSKPKAKRGKSDIKTQEMLKEEDLIKKSLQEARRQEYERKKREYEEQQRKKRELQKEMRQQKAKEKEERKRQRILSTSNKIKTKINHVQKGKKNEADLPPVTKESLPLCEPKLILTHALMHPYGTSPFNGQCSLKGSLGRAHLDNNLDYYAKFPSPSLDLVLKMNNQKPLMNGDIDSKDFHKLRDATDLPHKKPRYNESKNEVVPGVVAPANGQLPTDSSSVNSSSSSPETIQYVASSSPESDAVNKPETPNFPALNEANRNDAESPTFFPVNAVQIKREQTGSSLLMTSSCSVSMQSSTSSEKVKNEQAAIPRREGPSLGLDQGIDDLDSINVTLTLSPSSEMRVSETVASVAELIGCSPPRPSDIVIEPSWKSSGSITTTAPTSSAGIAYPQPRTVQGRSVLSPKDGDTGQKSPYPFTQFNLASKSNLQQKPSDGPYCRHCDVLIIGIGVIRGPADSTTEMSTDSSTEVREVKDSESSESGSDGAKYKIYSINVDAGERRDCFCSELCLKQYYSPLEAGRTRTKMETSESELNSSSCATTGSGNATTDVRQDDRGALVAEGLPVTSMVKLRRPSWKEEQLDGENEIKRRREIKWRRWQAEDFKQNAKQDLTPDEISELLDKYEAVYKPKDLVDDTRKCILCSDTGDGETEGPSRLLNLDVDVWVHLNCALWSLEVYETLNGALMNVMSAVQRGHDTECCVCTKTGATVVCHHMNAYNKVRCSKTYHFGCALKNECMFFKDKTMLCQEHKPSTDTEHRLPSYAVFRKVFINRDEIQQIASMLRHNQESGGDKLQTLRIGSVVVKSLGQLLLHQLQTFHTRNAVYPVGFKTIRYYWSMTDVKKRCQYHCAVEDQDGKPSFTIRTNEGQCFRGIAPKDAWNQILQPIQALRKDNGLNLWPSYITGEDLFGLTEQYVLRIIESMPGVDYMQGYNMRYGPSPIMELPLAVNPTGSARSEPHIRSSFKTRTRSIRNTSSSTSSTSRAAATPSQPTTSDDNNSPYMKHFVHSKASQYRKLKSEWKQNVYLGRSNIQGLGLFANKELEPNSMVIEYIGSIIRNEVANRKESIYESQNRGIYMFRIDSDSVIDATMAGAPARYINHSCMPNCVAEVVTFEKEQKIIIISNRKVERGEELTYDYKFDYEDDEHKISCLCGAPNCRKWMN